MRNRVTLLLATLSLLFCTTVGATAQVMLGSEGGAQVGTTVPDLPTPLTPETVREMVSLMSEEQVRLMLLGRLDAVAEAEAEVRVVTPSIIDVISDTWTAFYTPGLNAITSLPNLVSRQIEAFSNFATAFGLNGMLSMFAIVAAAMVVGYGAERLLTQLFQRWRKSPTAPESDTLLGTLKFLALRLWREILGIIIFYTVIRAIGASFLTAEQAAVAAPAVKYLVLFPRIVAALSRFVLAPEKPQFRLLSVSDHWAKYLHRNVIGLTLLGGFPLFIVGFNVRFGIALGETSLGLWLTYALFLYVIVIAWTARDGLTQMMRGNDPDSTDFDEQMARYYPHFMIAVSVAVWAVTNIIIGKGQGFMLLNAPHYTTMFWLLSAPLIDTANRGLVKHLQPPMIGDGPIAEQAYKSNKRSMIRIGRVLAFGLIVLIIAGTWNIDLANIGSSGVGAQFAGNLIEFLVICAVGYIVYEMMSLWVNRRLAREQSVGVTSDQAGGDGGGAGGSRLATVLPMVLIAAQMAIGTIFGLLAIGSLGIDTTPLLAGAGILGLAIGFGAQKLVTDIVSGVFFLIDDAFRIGEYIDVGGTMGAVEKISIRSMQMRHHRGNVHTIPYGGIEKVTNFSRDWVIMKLMFTVPFDTDPNKVKKIFKKIGAEMLEDPLFKEDFLEPFKSQGVFQFDDVGIVMRGKFMAKPGTQFTIRKEIYNRVRKEFEANGIEFARREVRVAIPGMEDHDDLNVEQRATIQGAASGAVQQQLVEEAANAEKK
ncbi:mechanosensitive ion channel protein MscS [Sulfitobacter sp. SK012]|uniref:mechanosensitive ion channel family protein n=1 Tax=Sulfitobacter sp. SK012 TaxID=1389005 RepID=UPI000E0CA49C|nr:mechanosensitive ion channel family protein [Sulfitobacter sp. SK012]AXI44686.1 mechanosensitive ion channel protein MscS [Sulfitobacter sp. SK012]